MGPSDSRASLGLDRALVVAGSTDGNAMALAADPAENDGVAVLGTTTVLKQWSKEPLLAPGPRQISDACFLQALLDGLTDLGVRGWQTLEQLGDPARSGS